MAAAIRARWHEHDGSLLAFLPGVAEIERTADALGALPPTSSSTASTAHRPRRAARRARPARAGHAQAGAGQRHRRDQPDARRRLASWSTAASPAARATIAAPA
jgi:HrpA-like RNA helicase